MNNIGSLKESPTVSVTESVCRVSALMSIRADTKCECLTDALASIYAQSALPDQLVIVIGGELPDGLKAVIACYQTDPRIASVEIVRSPYNEGKAAALNAGLARCNGDWVLFHDSNSVSHPERLAIQLAYTIKCPDVDVFSSWCEEVANDGTRRIKSSAIHHSAIVETLRWRNFLIHSSVLIRSSVLRRIGGYHHGLLADYDLYVRLALAGARFRVIPAELVDVRVGPKALRFAWKEICFRVFCWRIGFLNPQQFLIITLASLVSQAVLLAVTSNSSARRGTIRSGSASRALDFHGGRAALRLLGMLRPLRPGVMPARPAEIGICVFGAIGDALLSSTLIEDIKLAYPDARVWMIVSPTNAAIIPLLPSCDGTIVLPIRSPFQAVALLRRRCFDLLIDANQWLRFSALYAALSGARFTVGFRTAGQCRHYAYDRTVDHCATEHEVTNYRALLSSIGIPSSAQPSIRIPPDTAAPLIRPPYVVIHPWAGGSNAARKEWPEENWVRLGQALKQRGLAVVLTGAPGDCAKADALIRAARLSGIDLISVCGHVHLAGTAKVLKDAEVVVSVNTGVMHIAAALGVKLVALHGPTNPIRWGPLSAIAVNLVPDPVPPSVPTCYLNLGFEFPRDAPDCMRFIQLERVLKAVDYLTSGGHGGGWPIHVVCTGTSPGGPPTHDA
jgi:heptosyltransferase III